MSRLIIILGILVNIAARELVAAEFVNGKPFAEFTAAFDSVQAAAYPNQRPKAPVSSKQRDRTIKMADRIVEGELPFYSQEWLKVGTGEIDWFGAQREHQEWVAQLNRFRYLSTLGDAWELTSDIKYPTRALALMNDFRQFVMEKNEKKFFDPQRNNRLNLSIRMLSWSEAIRQMGMSAIFTGSDLETLLDFMTWQLDNLRRVTKPGLSNFQIAQSDALIMTALYFPDLPGAEERLQHGSKVLGQCFANQFRPDGTHWESTAGYHYWMLNTAIKYQALKKIFPAVPPVMQPSIFSGAIDFWYLASPWSFNDHGIRKATFPRYIPPLSSARKQAAGAGVENWEPPQYRAFPDAGIFFAGNAEEQVMFDAAKIGSGHSHNSRLMTLYAAFGEIMIADCGITTYEKNSPYYVGGRHTVNHATVNPDNLAQQLVDARSEYWRIEPDFAVLSGCFDAGYVKWESGVHRKNNPCFKAVHNRTVIWLAENGVLIFDRVAGAAERWNYVFPVPEQEQIKSDPQNASFHTVNAKRPNFRVRMLNPASDDVKQKIYTGDLSAPIARGWLGVSTGGEPMPLLEFSLGGVTAGATVLTRVSAFKPGETPYDVDVLEASKHRVAFRYPDGRIDNWFFDSFEKSSLDFAGTATVVDFKGEHLLLRSNGDGKAPSIFVDRAETLRVGDKILVNSLGQPQTGWIK